MGRSAKVHKRIKKPKSSGSHQQQTSIPAPSTKPPPPTTTINSTTTTLSASVPPNTKRRTTLKDKAIKSKTRQVGQGNETGHILGGADYVELMMGSRRKAREEAEKLSLPS